MVLGNERLVFVPKVHQRQWGRSQGPNLTAVRGAVLVVGVQQIVLLVVVVVELVFHKQR